MILGLKLMFFTMFFISCASTKQNVKTKPISRSPQKFNECQNKSRNPEVKYLTTAAQARAARLASCFSNYIKFEQNKKRLIKSCNILTVRRSGSVQYAYSRGMRGSPLPKDIKMCMEQEFWKMDFKSMQLERRYTIQFPIVFSSL